MNDLIKRQKNGDVFLEWLKGATAQNHNGTLRSKQNGILEYANTDIALQLPEHELTGSLETLGTRDYDYVILNPEETTSRTMNKHVFAIIKLLKSKRILVVPSGDFEILKHEAMGI